MALNDYTQLLYIESNGTQYINTGVVTGVNDIKIEASFKYTNLTSQGQILFGASVSNRWLFFSADGVTTKWKVQIGGSNTEQYFDNPDTDWHTVVLDSTTTSLKLDTTELTLSSSSTNINQNLYIFARNSAGTANFQSSAQISYLKIYKGSEIVRDYIPAKRNSDDALGLYDKINDVFYGNSGSGTFIAGEAAPYYTVSAQLSPSEAEGNISISSTRVQAGFPVTVQYIDTLNKWRLVSWSIAGSPVSTTNPYTFILEGDTTITANVENYGRCILM